MNNDIIEINIRNLIQNDCNTLSGKDKGKDLRQQANLDIYDSTDDIIIIVIDSNFTTLDSSFFLGMFEISIQKLGKFDFYEKYQFKCKENFINNIKAFVNTALDLDVC